MSRVLVSLGVLVVGVAALVVTLAACGVRSGLTDQQFRSLLEECKRELQPKMEAAIAKWRLDSFKRYDLDQIRGTLVFSDDAGHRVSCTVQIVGTFSTASQTWLWSWASPWVAEPVKRDSGVVREFGRTNRIERLTKEKWPATEADGWAMTGLAARLAGAESAYRLANREAYIFMLIKKVESDTDGK